MGKAITVLLLVFMVAFFVGFLVMLILYFTQLSGLIDPGNCPGNPDLYTVIPGATGTIQTNCGVNGNQICTFNVSNLAQAIADCNANELCKQFIFSSNTQQMSYVGTQSSQGVTSYNFYIKP